MVNIRKMTSKDLPVVLEIENECFKSPWSMDVFQYELSGNPVNRMLVLEEDDKVVGFIDFMITFNSSTISQIAVAKAVRGKGYGNRLLRAMIDVLPKEGEDQVETITIEVRKSNMIAHSMYVKNGFERVVDKPNYYSDGEDAVYMIKRLI